MQQKGSKGAALLEPFRHTFYFAKIVRPVYMSRHCLDMGVKEVRPIPKEIKTKVIEKNIRTIDKAADLSSYMENAAAKTKEQAEAKQNQEQHEHHSPAEYAADKAVGGARDGVIPAVAAFRHPYKNAARNISDARQSMQTARYHIRTAKHEIIFPFPEILSSSIGKMMGIQTMLESLNSCRMDTFTQSRAMTAIRSGGAVICWTESRYRNTVRRRINFFSRVTAADLHIDA